MFFFWHVQLTSSSTATAPPTVARKLPDSGLTSSPVSPAGEDGWAAWQQHRRHFFVLTAAGKPLLVLGASVFYMLTIRLTVVTVDEGDDAQLSWFATEVVLLGLTPTRFMAVIQALISVVADQGDAIRSITVGCCQVLFLLRGSLYLVAVSSREEALAALRRQLELLHQAIVMTVTGGVERLLQRNPGYDVQQLLSGSKVVLTNLLHSCCCCPGWMFGSLEPAAAAAADRAAAAAALQAAVRSSDALYGVLLAGRRVVAVETGRGPPPPHVFDLLLLTNFTNSNESLRHNETFVPICLPNFQPNAFLHAPKWVTGLLTDKHIEVYVTFDPLTDKETGLELAEQLKQLFADKGRQQELLLTGV
eukprot:gene7620-7822_t